MTAGTITRVVFRAAGCLALLLALPSCSHRSDSELEAIALSLAVEEAKEFVPYFWSRDRFPLTVGFFTGPDLDSTGCVPGWHRELERYVNFMNGGRQPLLRLTSSAEADFDAMVYYGSFEEMRSSLAYRLINTWEARPGISYILKTQVHPFQFTGSIALGSNPVIRYAVHLDQIEPRSIELNGGCSSAAQPSVDRADLLLQGASFTIRTNIEGRYPGLERQIGWRANRRFLSATRLMPPKVLKRSEQRAAMVEALLSE